MASGWVQSSLQACEIIPQQHIAVSLRSVRASVEKNFHRFHTIQNTESAVDGFSITFKSENRRQGPQPACLLVLSLQAEYRLNRRRVKEKPLFDAVRYIHSVGLDVLKGLEQFLDELSHSALKLFRIGLQSLFSS